MVKLYRGSNFRIFARNFEGDIFRNNSNKLNIVSITPDEELALKRYANQSAGGKNPYLALLLVFDIPEDCIYYEADKTVEGKYAERVHDASRDLAEKAKNGEQVVYREFKNWKREADDKWKSFFLKTKYLKSVYEVSEEFRDMEEFRQKSNKISINGDKREVKKYLKKRKNQL